MKFGVYTCGEMRRVLAFAVFVVFLPAISHAKAPVDISVCAIAAHPSKFRNKTVRIRAAAINFEGYILVDGKDGKFNVKCGRINLDFDSVEHDETTKEFLRLFGTQLTSPQCDREKELNESMAHILDPRVPPRRSASIVMFWARGTKSLRPSLENYDTRHMRVSADGGQFNTQLDVGRVANLDVTDTQPVSKP